ncbi:FBD-associated F-box protein [Quillaja saponaria]|uniref:FBD-associated F-box protein n=1 Tax=Quillaja saponaria TaxID=32244 RepID=A0AAD7QF44_QUISA|nr:FBD-associated F-box protein [Quillaja saponaria]
MNVKTWVLAALRRNIEQLEISIPRVALPISVYTCKTEYIVGGYKIEISCPSLEYFTLTDEVCRDYFIEGLPNLKEANLNGYAKENAVDHMVKLLANVHNVKSLSSACNYELPIFKNLVHLEIGFKQYGWVLLVKLLERSSRLQVLIIKKVSWNVQDSESCWMPPKFVPTCLSLCLTTFQYRGFLGLENELEFSGYILKNACMLKAMTICTKPLARSRESSVFSKVYLCFPEDL